MQQQGAKDSVRVHRVLAGRATSETSWIAALVQRRLGHGDNAKVLAGGFTNVDVVLTDAFHEIHNRVLFPCQRQRPLLIVLEDPPTDVLRRRLDDVCAILCVGTKLNVQVVFITKTDLDPARPMVDQLIGVPWPVCEELGRHAEVITLTADTTVDDVLGESGAALGLGWFRDIPDEQWSSTCGRYVIVRLTLQEAVPRDEFIVRKIEPHMALTQPDTLGVAIAVQPDLLLAMAVAEQDARYEPPIVADVDLSIVVSTYRRKRGRSWRWWPWR